jgi:hypothetical protein
MGIFSSFIIFLIIDGEEYTTTTSPTAVSFEVSTADE